MLGTFVAVEAIVREGENPSPAIEAAYSAIAMVERLMHPARAGSDLARIAAAAPGTAVPVHGWTFEVLEFAQRLHRESEGAFDPCLPSAPGRMSDLELRDSQVIRHAQVAIDLGGIAKGFAVDQAVNELRRHGVASGLVNAGGDLRVFGPQTRTVELRSHDGRSHAVELRDVALAVSGPRGASAPAEHRGYYHGGSRAAVEGQAVAISAPTAVLADALGKCAMLCEPALSARLLARYHARSMLD